LRIARNTAPILVTDLLRDDRSQGARNRALTEAPKDSLATLSLVALFHDLDWMFQEVQAMVLVHRIDNTSN
jgi:hypothetical protein